MFTIHRNDHSLTISEDDKYMFDCHHFHHLMFRQFYHIFKKYATCMDVVVARAYRMGATGRVEVEQLIAEDSIEELMERINEGGQLADMSDFRAGGRSTPASTKKKDGDVGSPNSARQPKTSHAKIHHLLKNVRLARGSARAGRIPKVVSNLGDDNPKDDGDRKMPAKRESDIESSISRSQARVRFGESTIHSFE